MNRRQFLKHSACAATALGLAPALTSCVSTHWRRHDTITLTERIGRQWDNELIHFDLQFAQGEFPGGHLRMVAVQENKDCGEIPVQLSDVCTHADGSLKSAKVWLMATLPPNAVISWRLLPGASTVPGDLKIKPVGDGLEIVTALTGARFNLGEATLATPIDARDVPSYLAAIRHRSGTWGGRGWFETGKKCRSYNIRLVASGPVFAKVAFEYRFDGFRGAGRDIYRGHVRVASGQELIEIVEEEFCLGDPSIYREAAFRDRAQEILWDWWQWRPHEAGDNFCFSIYEGLAPTKARWFGHTSTIPEKRRGDNPLMFAETDYKLDFRENRFEFSINAHLACLPDQAKSYMAWRDGDADSDALGVVGLRLSDWLHPDMVPHLEKSVQQHTDTADLRIYASAQPDLVIKAPLHQGRRVWGLLTLQMPHAGLTEDVIQDANMVPAFRREASQCLRLASKYSARPLDKVKDWCLQWETRRTYPRLFVKEGGLESVRSRIKSSEALSNIARSQWDKPITRYLIEGGRKNAEDAYHALLEWCREHIEILFNHGFCSHLGVNMNQLSWWMQEMSGQFDILMAAMELTPGQKESLKAHFSFCAHMLWDDGILPPRRLGYGWGPANTPPNCYGGRTVTACVLKDNPDAERWLALAVEHLQVYLDANFSPDGSALSSPHFSSTQADPLVNMSLSLYFAGAMGPIQNRNSRVANFTRHMMDRLTPPDPRAGGVRVLPTIGQTEVETCSSLGKFAVLMALTDKKLAAEAFWLWRRAGMSIGGYMNGLYCMHEAVEPLQPEIHSSVYPGFGAFLRNGFPDPRETYLAIRAGNFSFDHYDMDAGSFLIYAKGAPLCLDFSNSYTDNAWQSLWHNSVSWNVREHEARRPAFPRGDPRDFYTGRIWYDHQYDPHTLMDRTADSEADNAWAAYAGRIVSHSFCDEADAILAVMPLREFVTYPFFNREEGAARSWGPQTEFDRFRLRRDYRWKRRIIFVKDADVEGPNYFLIQDDFGGQDELPPMLNVWCCASEQRIAGDTVRWKGQYDVDLDMHVAWPKGAAIGSRTWWHSNPGPLGAVRQMAEGRESQIAAHVPNTASGGGFTILLYPRHRRELVPTYESSADGAAVKVTVGIRTDVILANAEPRQWEYEGVRGRGTAAVVKQDARATVLVLCEAGTVSARGMSVEAEMPASLRVEQGKPALLTAMAPGQLTLRLPKVFAGGTVTDGEGQSCGQVAADGLLRIRAHGGRKAMKFFVGAG